ncbi:MAG: sensor histidine kinase [Sphingobacteriia bacterium]|jgi:LytS/YehU family sensor histidine kinase
MKNKSYSILIEVAIVSFTFLLFWLIYYAILGKIWPSNNIGFYRVATHLTQCATLCLAAFFVFPSYIKHKNKWQLFIISFLTLLFFIQCFDAARSILSKPLFYPIGASVKKTVNNAPTQSYFLQNFISSLTYYLLGLGYAFSRDWFKKEHKSLILEKEIAQAELTLLRNQLNPHFLFNTINNIYYLALIQSAKTAEALLQLSDLLRYVLAEKEHWVTLDKEFECLEKFINLHRLRFPNDVINLKVENDENFSNIQIPPMILITFAENAFKHGESGGAEEPIDISISVNKNKLSYVVTNKMGNNISKNQNSGIGIPNLVKRLNILYPEKHKLHFDVSATHFIANLEINL